MDRKALGLIILDLDLVFIEWVFVVINILEAYKGKWQAIWVDCCELIVSIMDEVRHDEELGDKVVEGSQYTRIVVVKVWDKWELVGHIGLGE